MPLTRSVLRPWLLMLLLACSLLGRPLHESWHIAHGEGDSAWAASAAAEHGSEDGNGNGEGDQQQPGDGCAWCLFHLQATLPGATPMPGLAKGEGVERHAALRYGLPVGHCTSAAEARGPPRG